MKENRLSALRQRKRKILSLLTAAAMSVLVAGESFTAFSAEPEVQMTQSSPLSDVSFEGKNQLGDMLMSNLDTSSLNQNFDSVASINNVTVADGKAEVTYFTDRSSEIVLAFYSDDGTKMYTSCTSHVDPQDDGEVSDKTEVLTVPEGTPEFFLVKAYLVNDKLEPLCEAFSSTYYTEEVTKIRNSTVSDYDEDLVVNLDKSDQTNFLVLKEDTVQIPYDGTHNLLVGYDSEDLVYTFSDTDSHLTDLKAGDAVYYDYNGEKLAFTVGSITQDGGNTVIRSADAELTDVFDLVKIEETLSMEVEDPEITDLGYGLTYEGSYTEEENVVGAGTEDHPIEITANTKKYTFGIDFELANPDGIDLPHVKAEAKAKIKGSVTYSVPITVKMYVSGLTTYTTLDYSTKVTFDASIELSGSVTFYFKRFKANLFNLVSAEAGIGVKIEGKCSFGLLHIEFCNGMTIQLENKKIITASLHNKNPQFKVDGPEAEVFIGLVAEFSGEIGPESLSGELNAGVKFSGSPAPLHSCPFCIKGRTDFIIESFIEEKHGKGSVKPYIRLYLADFEIPLSDFYLSSDLGFGWGTCPNLEKKQGTTDPTDSPKPTEPPKTTTEETKIKYVMDYATAACVDDNGNLFLWGNPKMSIGNPENQCAPLTPVPTYIRSGVKNVFLGNYRGAYIDQNDNLYTWGNNSADGELGAGIGSETKEKHLVLKDVVNASLGAFNGGAVTKDGGLYTWGNATVGTLGFQSDNPVLSPVRIMENMRFVEFPNYYPGISAIAVSNNDELYMWGSYYSPGVTDFVESAKPEKVMDHVKKACTNGATTAVIKDDGALYLWGGDVNMNLCYTPEGEVRCQQGEVIKLLDNVKDVALANLYGAALLNTGELYLWGNNLCNVMGEDPSAPKRESYYYPFVAMENVNAISICGATITAIMNDGSIKSWGNNTNGIVGNGESGKMENNFDRIVTVPYTLTLPVENTASTYSLASAEALEREFTQTGLIPGGVYNFYSMVSDQAEKPLSADNLFYIHQLTADENGTITVRYKLNHAAASVHEFVVYRYEQVVGDVTNDGSVNAKDANQVLIAAAKLGTGVESGLTERQEQISDVNSDGVINAKDSNVILRYAAAVGTGLKAAITEYV